MALIGKTQEYAIEKVRTGFKIYANDTWWHIIMIRVYEEDIYSFTCDAPFMGKIAFCIKKSEHPTVWIRKNANY
jgi:hypothetical protein